MAIFSKVKINEHYFVREEDDQIVFFSGIARSIHFISKDAYLFLKEAEKKSSDMIYKEYCSDDEDKEIISSFFDQLKEKGIIEFV